MPASAAEPETKVLPRPTDAAPAAASRPAEATGAPRASAAPGATTLPAIGRYQLLQRLGHGGMATVYLARAVGSGGFEKLVALKVIHPHLADEQHFVEMFLDEARIAARIHHPHVVEILDLGESAGRYYMVMEYVEGDTLAALLRAQRERDEQLPLAVVLQIVADACAGLEAAHAVEDAQGRRVGLVHRDVSPQNILVGLDGWTKLVDFGIMKAAGRSVSTLTGQLRGKLAYMAPEQARGEPLDARADLFSLGVVWWELLASSRLFARDADAETLEAVRRCEVPALVNVRGDVPPRVEALLRRLLASEPGQRPASAAEVGIEVRALLREEAASVDPRQDLATLARRTFAKRSEYLRGVVRASAGAQVVPLRPGAMPELPAVDTPQGVPTPEPTSVRTLGSLAGAPARHWTLWLILPLVGAALGTAVVAASWRRPQADAAVEASPATAPAWVAPAQAVPAAHGTKVTWVFNTEPTGAEIRLDGRTVGTTPLELEVDAGEEVHELAVEQEGYELKVLRLAAVRSDNFHLVLTRAGAPAAGPAPTPPAVVPGVRGRPTRLSAPGAPSAAPKAGGPTSPPDAPTPDRGFDPMPDFDREAKKEPPPSG